MGFFSNLFGKKEKEEQRRIEQEQQKDKMSTGYMEDGKRIFELVEAFVDSKSQDYDTTRVIFDEEQPIMVDVNGAYYDCMVYWLGSENETFMEASELRQEFKPEHVIVGFNKELMLNDRNYFKTVMKGLLQRERIKEYIERGLMTEDELEEKRQSLLEEARGKDGEEKKKLESEAAHCIPCGRYVGEAVKHIDENGKTYIGKRFNGRLGYEYHNLPEMEQERQEHKMELERKRQSRIAEKRAQIERLQSEIQQYEEQR